MNQINSKDKHIRYERGNHLIFWYRADFGFTTRLVETIEYGTTVDSAVSQSTTLILFSLIFFILIF